MKGRSHLLLVAVMLLAATVTQAASRQQTIRIDNVTEGA